MTRTGDLSAAMTVAFSTSNGTAASGSTCTPGADYIAASAQTITFNPSVSLQVVGIPLCSDNVTDANETVNLTLSNAAGGTLGLQSTAVLTINDTAGQTRNPAPITLASATAANPNPSTITVSNGPTSVGSVRVTLYDLSHSLPANIDVLLVGPNGARYVLMGDAGAAVPVNPNVTATLTFSDAAAAVLPDSAQLVTGEFKPTTYDAHVSSFASPAPSGPYVEPGSLLSRPDALTLAGNFGLQDGNGVWSLYVRDDNGTLAPTTGSGEITGGWGLELLASNVTTVSVSGRVFTADGSSLKNAIVSLTDSLGVRRRVTTSSFGSFKFDGVATGEAYIIAVSSKRFRFAQRVLQVFNTLQNQDFVGIE